MIFLVHYRGGASEPSVATLTGDVDGSSQYMYDTYYVRQVLGTANYSTHTHIQEEN